MQKPLFECLARLFNAPPIEDRRQPQTAGGPVRSLRILLAEDNIVNQKVATAILTKAGHVVEVVANGAEAIAAVERTHWDVVLMDVQMPVMDGIEATQRIRTLALPGAKVPIVALTAHAMTGAREQYLAAGMDDYLTKPLSPTSLLAKLASLPLTGQG